MPTPMVVGSFDLIRVLSRHGPSMRLLAVFLGEARINSLAVSNWKGFT